MLQVRSQQKPRTINPKATEETIFINSKRYVLIQMYEVDELKMCNAQGSDRDLQKSGPDMLVIIGIILYMTESGLSEWCMVKVEKL